MATGNKTLDKTLATSIVKPSSENLRVAKNAAYKAADDAGFLLMQIRWLALLKTQGQSFLLEEKLN